MGCGSCAVGCSSNGCGKNNGCSTGGCNKLNAYDWLENMLSPDVSEQENVYEVRFKNTRKAFYRNVHGLRLNIGDPVVVESDRGYDLGLLSLGGVMARLQLKRKGVHKPVRDLPRIFRRANEKDIELLDEARKREKETRVRAREIIEELDLSMKLSDVEFQADNTKAIFYYIADHRVDFRELIKILAREFHIRVEMRQIGLRHEAGLVGGIGSCGRELCCSTWLSSFKTVSTTAARYQNLSLNPMKISGLCGRLKCCLNFELDTYLDALQDFPLVSGIETVKGYARLQKTDIFKRRMWFSYDAETTWYELPIEGVKEILALNDRGIKAEALGSIPIAKQTVGMQGGEWDFVDVVGTTFDPASDEGRKNRKKKKKKALHKNMGDRQPDNRPVNRDPAQRKEGNPSQNPPNNGQNANLKPKQFEKREHPPGSPRQQHKKKRPPQKPE